MQKIASKDGTQIAFEISGSGSSILIIGGSLADHEFYTPLANELSRDLAVCNFDRRGRGESGDTLPYSVDREIEDIAALIDVIGEPVVVYGHSAGSALALRAAATGLPIKKLILADPPYTPHSDNDRQVISRFAEETTKVQELHDSARHRENAAIFLSSFGLPDEVVEDTLNSPSGAGMIASAKALPYDYAVLGNGLVPIEVAKQVNVSTVILAAGYSLEAAQQLSEAIPGSVLKTLSSSTHEVAPNDLANIIKEAMD